MDETTEHTDELAANERTLELQIPVVPLTSVNVEVRSGPAGKMMLIGPIVLAVPLDPASARTIGEELVSEELVKPTVAIAGADILSKLPRQPRMDIPRG